MAWPVLPHGFLGAQGSETDSYQIQRSLRFNSADSAYLNRTPASAGNRKTWTWSGWVKRSKLGLSSASLLSSLVGSLDFSIFGFDNNDKLRFYTITGPFSTYVDYGYTTVSVFRDLSSWYHIVLAIDTTNATQENRIFIYVNGVQQTLNAGSGAFDQNINTWVNYQTSHAIGLNLDTLAYFDGYLTEINFIDGQALTPSYFGETDPITGRWKAKAYSGTYGTNGFYLNFSDNSGTTATTLGKDSAPISGTHTAANNWTPNNFSVTAGAGNDSLTDSPANYGTISTTLTDDTYQISRSLRFNSADSAYLNRTPASAGNRKTWTLSFWTKKTTLGTIQTLFSAYSSGSVLDNIGFTSSDAFTFDIYSGSQIALKTTTQVFRDTSSWYHFVVVWDSTNGTATNRTKLYVNGSEITNFASSTNPNLDANTTFNNNVLQYIKRYTLPRVWVEFIVCSGAGEAVSLVGFN